MVDVKLKPNVKQLDSNFFLHIFICLVWMSTILMEYVRAVFMRIPILNTENGYVAIYTIYVIVLLLAFPSFAKRIKINTFFFALSIISIYLLTYALFPANSVYLDSHVITFFLTILPMVFLGNVFDAENMLKELYILSCVTIVVTIFYSIFIADAMSSVQSEYMGSMMYAYNILPHLCLIAYYALCKTKWHNILLLAVGTAFLFILGNRGSLVCLLTFTVICILFFSRTKKKLITMAIVTVAAIIILAGDNLTKLMLWVRQIALNTGLSVRSIDAILNSTFFKSSGRDTIRESLLAVLPDHWIIGTGIFGDRVICGSYAHNLILEILVEFGIIVGVIILIALAVLIYKGLKNSSSKETRAFICVLLCASVMKLMLSGSYFDDSLFFMLIGFCMANSRKCINYRG